MDAIKDWAGSFGAILGIAAMFYTWLTSRSAKNSERLDQVEKEVLTQGKQVTQMAAELAHLPDKDMVNDLNLEIARLVGTVSTLNEKVSGMDRAVSRMDRYLRASDTK